MNQELLLTFIQTFYFCKSVKTIFSRPNVTCQYSILMTSVIVSVIFTYAFVFMCICMCVCRVSCVCVCVRGDGRL